MGEGVGRNEDDKWCAGRRDKGDRVGCPIKRCGGYDVTGQCSPPGLTASHRTGCIRLAEHTYVPIVHKIQSENGPVVYTLP